MKTINLEAKDDHIERISKSPNPVYAVEELIWNSLDADATKVDVALGRNELGGVVNVCVRDNGTGIEYSDVDLLFGGIGGSWKLRTTKSKFKHRYLHGKLGQGRLKTFSIGNRVQWNCVYLYDGKYFEYSIVCNKSNIRRAQVSNVRESTKLSTGTEVIISDIFEQKDSLLLDSTISLLEDKFTLYMNDYDDIEIIFNGIKLDPGRFIDRIKEFEIVGLEVEEGVFQTFSVLIMELKGKKEVCAYVTKTDLS